MAVKPIKLHPKMQSTITITFPTGETADCVFTGGAVHIDDAQFPKSFDPTKQFVVVGSISSVKLP